MFGRCNFKTRTSKKQQTNERLVSKETVVPHLVSITLKRGKFTSWRDNKADVLRLIALFNSEQLDCELCAVCLYQWWRSYAIGARVVL